jgi:hypothetical protein
VDWQPSVVAKGKELKIGLLQAGGFYVRAAPDAITIRWVAGCIATVATGHQEVKPYSPQRRKGRKVKA